jgi:hypothetical protein
MPTKYEVIKQRRESDPEFAERLKSYSKKHREANLEQKRERNRTQAASKRRESREAYNAYMREWTEKNKDRLNAERRERRAKDQEYAERIRVKDRQRPKERTRHNRLKVAYGITLEEYNQKLLDQGGRCAICGKEHADSLRRNLNVDHCHTTGEVRDLLCSRCNLTLGKFEDRIELFQAAIAYLTKHKKE